jgi:cytochrome P450
MTEVAEQHAVEITDYAEIVEVFRSDRFSAGVGGEHDHIYRTETMVRLDGQEHLERRRTMNRILRRDGHRWFRDTALFPTVERNLRSLLSSPDADGFVRTDLVSFALRIQVALASALIGLEGVESDAEADELFSIFNRMGIRETFLEALHGFDDTEKVISRGLAAKRQFVERYFRPSLEAHRHLVEEARAGRLAEADLPHDILLMIAAHQDAHWLAEDVAVKDVMMVFSGAVRTSADALASVFDELARWFDEHPEDEPLRTDPGFLLGAVNETLRLHPVQVAFLRRAREDVVLSRGTAVAAGQLAVLRTPAANRDRSVFGDDADSFNPRRQVPAGQYPYGLAFGSGAHMCYGMPVVLGSEGIDGSVVHTLQMLFEAGLERDPERLPQKYAAGEAHRRYESWVSYPVRFAPRGAR